MDRSPHVCLSLHGQSPSAACNQRAWNLKNCHDKRNSKEGEVGTKSNTRTNLQWPSRRGTPKSSGPLARAQKTSRFLACFLVSLLACFFGSVCKKQSLLLPYQELQGECVCLFSCLYVFRDSRVASSVDCGYQQLTMFVVAYLETVRQCLFCPDPLVCLVEARHALTNHFGSMFVFHIFALLKC